MNDITGLDIRTLLSRFRLSSRMRTTEGIELNSNYEAELLRRLTLNKELVDALKAAALEMESFGSGNPTAIKVRAALAKVSER